MPVINHFAFSMCSVFHSLLFRRNTQIVHYISLIFCSMYFILLGSSDEPRRYVGFEIGWLDEYFGEFLLVIIPEYWCDIRAFFVCYMQLTLKMEHIRTYVLHS